MEYGTPDNLASYFFTGLLATIATSDLDALSCLVELRKKINEEIDAELERWSDGLEPDNE
jgi:hypothetical protein